MSKELSKVLEGWEKYAFSTNLEERNADLCQAIKEITQAAANKAAEEGGLPVLKFDVETSDELTDTQNQHVNNLRTLNELLICFSSWEPQVCVVGNVRAGDSVNAIRQAIAADRAARPVANKAEVEHVPFAYVKFRAAQNISSEGDVDANEWYEFCEREDIGDDKLPAFPLYATPPETTGASTVLTDERIDVKTISDGIEEGLLLCKRVFQHFNKDRLGRDSVQTKLLKARKALSEVAAQAGQVAVPKDVRMLIANLPLPNESEERKHGFVDCKEALLNLLAAPSPAKESK